MALQEGAESLVLGGIQLCYRCVVLINYRLGEQSVLAESIKAYYKAHNRAIHEIEEFYFSTNHKTTKSMNDTSSIPKSTLEHLRWIAPLISILIFAPITIYDIIQSTNVWRRVLLGVGLLVLTIFLLWWFITEWRRRESLKDESLIDRAIEQRLTIPLENLGSRVRHFEAEEAFRYLSTVYGWGYESLDVSGTIDLNGGMSLERAVTVQVRRPLDRLPQSLHIQPEQVDNSHKNANVRVTSRTEGIRTPESKIYPLPSGWVVDFSIAPSLQAGQRFSFNLIEDVPKKTYQVGIKRSGSPGPGEQFDWLSWRIDRPTRRLSITVIFPRGYKPQGIQTLVFYQPLPKNPDDGQQHKDEETRTKQLLAQKELDGLVAVTLNIELPVLGLIYMVAWDPLEE